MFDIGTTFSSVFSDPNLTYFLVAAFDLLEDVAAVDLLVVADIVGFAVVDVAPALKGLFDDFVGLVVVGLVVDVVGLQLFGDMLLLNDVAVDFVGLVVGGLDVVDDLVGLVVVGLVIVVAGLELFGDMLLLIVAVGLLVEGLEAAIEVVVKGFATVVAAAAVVVGFVTVAAAVADIVAVGLVTAVVNVVVVFNVAGLLIELWVGFLAIAAAVGVATVVLVTTLPAAGVEPILTVATVAAGDDFVAATF